MSILLLGNNELYSQGIPELNKAGSLYIENKFSEALEECKKVLSITSNDSSNHYLLSGTHFMIGTIYSSLENYDSAIYHFEYNINNYAFLLTEDQLEKSLFSLDVHYIKKLLLITDTLESPGLSNDKKIETYLNSISIIGTAIELFTNFNDTERVMKFRKQLFNNYTYISLVYGVIGDETSAINYATKTIDNADEIDDMNMLGDAYYSLLNGLYLQGDAYSNDIRQYIEYAEEAIILIEKIPHLQIRYTLLSTLTKYFDRAGEDSVVESLYEKAIDVAESLNDPREVANTKYMYGLTLSTKMKSKKAQELLKQSLEFYINVNDTLDQITVLNALGLNAQHKGAIQLSKNYFLHAYDLSRMVDDTVRIINSSSNLSSINHELGLYKKADGMVNMALSLNKDPIKSLDLKNQKALILSSWQQHEEAGTIYKEILKQQQELNFLDQARALNNLANNFEQLGDIDSAIIYYEKAFQNMVELNIVAGRRTIMVNLIRSYSNTGAVDKTVKLVKDFYKESETADVGSLIQLDLVLSDIYIDIDTDFSIEMLESVIRLTENLQYFSLEPRGSAFSKLGNIYLNRKNNYQKAIDYYERSIPIFEQIRRTATGKQRQDILASVIDVYSNLSYAHFRLGDHASTYEVMELSRAKSLNESILGDNNEISVNAPKLESIQSQLGPDQAIIMYDLYTSNDPGLVEFVITNDNIYAEAVTDTSLLNLIYQGPFENNDIISIIYDYKELVEDLGSVDLKEVSKFSSALYEHLISPISKHLEGKTNLIIIPEGVLSIMPFEMLLDAEGKYLIENYDIQYIQSVTTWDLLNDRSYDKRDYDLLAIGDVIYDQETYDVDYVENDKMLSQRRSVISDSILYRGSLNESYASLGYKKWKNLPWSKKEIKEIGSLFSKKDFLKGKNASEEKLKDLSKKQKLKEYKILHFATHGLFETRIPELSAIVLSQNKNDRGEDDGYLNVKEITELELEADLISLSACNTGLGKIYEGDGVIGLTQSFIIAGSNGVSTTLWTLDDESARTFMKSAYKYYVSGKSFEQSLSAVKRDFINGDNLEYKDPFYWAPFVYYGK